MICDGIVLLYNRVHKVVKSGNEVVSKWSDCGHI